MLVIDSLNHVVSFSSLEEKDKLNPLQYFQNHPDTYVLDMENRNYLTKKMAEIGENALPLLVEYGPDMFIHGFSFVRSYGYAIAVNTERTPVVLLRNESSTYVHQYQYSGGVDTWFIDKYSCIFLMGCNEYSVELILSALNLWKGSRLVLVGEEWEGIIPMLPDIPGVECFIEYELTAKRVAELTEGHTPLYITFGLPHEETMDRYNQGIMSYDEVMSFLFFFSNMQELGDENPDKYFCVIDAFYGNLGLFALFGKATTVAKYVKSRGFIPVIRILRAGDSFYSDGAEDDVWSKFYNQPEGYNFEDIKNSKNVCFTPGFYNGSIQSNLMEQMSSATNLSWPNGTYNRHVLDILEEKEHTFLPHPDETLGVLARGTDYVNTHMSNHWIHANKEIICEKIDETLAARPELKYIYLATEDADYCVFFKDRYGDKITFTDQKRFTVEPGKMLAEHHRNDKNRSDGFSMGIDYILSIHLLAKCNSLIASGGCAGVGEVLKQNEGKYKNVFIFDLGKNP